VVILSSYWLERGVKGRGGFAPSQNLSPSPNMLTFEARVMLLFGEGDKGGEAELGMK